jgi:hypothetical protein
MVVSDGHTLEFLLAFDGRIHHLEKGYWLKFEIKRAVPEKHQPHGLRYSFTLHDPRGRRLVGFDNAHAVPGHGSRKRRMQAAHDHWHRSVGDIGRPYSFVSADQLLADFFAEVRRTLKERGVSEETVSESYVKDEK